MAKIPETTAIDKWDYITDPWVFFNPPGFGSFDYDPDDEIPFYGFDDESY